MSRRPKLCEEDFPLPGTVFVTSTLDGRMAAGRVLRRQFEGGAQAALIATTPWLGDQSPPLDTPALRETLILNHHRWKETPDVFWVWDLMPDEFTIIGVLALSEDDLVATSNSFGGWQGVPIQALKQWRWDNDREKLLAEEAQQLAEEMRIHQQRAAARAEWMNTLTLESLAQQKWFTAWEDIEPEVPLDASREIINQLINDLRVAPKLTQAIVKKFLKQSVQAFNRLDSQQHFIATIEREDIYETYEQILCAVKVPQLTDKIDQWREW